MSETLGTMFWDRVEKSGGGPAQMFKRHGAWTTLTWREVGEIVREVALGLIALGRQPGDAVALLAASRAEWVQADFAIFSAGCITVPVYPTYPPDLIAYVVNDSGARTIIVEDPGQLAKVLEVRDKTPGLEHIIVMTGYEATQPPKMVLTWEMLRRVGLDNAARHAGTLAARLAGTKPDDLASIVYTSGTTGPPKGVMQTHGNHIAAQKNSESAAPCEEGWVHLLFLPLAHSFARLESFLGVYRGLCTAFAENLDKVGDNLKEVRPHFICSVPRVFEKVYAKILAGVEAGSPTKKKIFNWAIGQPLDNVEIKIAADGEILIRGANVAKGYLKQPEATAEVFEPSGWFHSGDIGRLGEDGFLFITDRKKDLIVTAGGMNIAPQNVENMLKADPFISQVMVYGDRRPYPVALITVNPEELTKFARDQGILVNDPTVLVKHPKIVERVGRTVEEKNTQLQSYAKIKKFTVLPGDFSLDGGELTPTLKVKRKVVAQKYQDAIEALYR